MPLKFHSAISKPSFARVCESMREYARSVLKAASESFEIALKESISNVLEGFDGVDKLSYEQKRGAFNFMQRN